MAPVPASMPASMTTTLPHPVPPAMGVPVLVVKGMIMLVLSRIMAAHLPTTTNTVCVTVLFSIIMPPTV
jgi:hypothetical protein